MPYAVIVKVLVFIAAAVRFFCTFGTEALQPVAAYIS